MSASVRVRCPSCHRVERWEDGGVHVELPGGARKPSAAVPRAVFDIYAGALRNEHGPVVGRCEACGLPMVLQAGDATPMDWVVPHPDGDLVMSATGVQCADQPVDLDDAEARVRAAYPQWGQWSRGDVVANGFLTGILPLLVFPMVLWVSAVTVVIVFYSHWASGGGSVGMP